MTLVAAACGPGEPTAPPPDSVAPSAPAGSPTGPSPEPVATPPTSEPVTPAPATTQPGTPEPASPDPANEHSDPPAAGADACAGTDENRDFYASVADAVSWAVYCPDLPDGWFVVCGQYRLASGGRMEISYRGPNGAGLMLQEGSFCAAGADCVPPGEDAGAAAFGDREGALVRTDGGWAVVVDRGEQPSWLLLLTGVAEPRARTIAGDLLHVGG